MATQSRRHQSRVPRTIPGTYPDSMAITSAAMIGGMPNSNFSLTSSSPGSRRPAGTDSGAPSSGPFSGDDDYFCSTTSAMNYSSLSVSDHTFATPVMSTMGGYDSDPTFEFLTDDVLSGDNAADLNLAASNYLGQGQTEDPLNSGYVPLDVSPYNPGMMMNSFFSDISWQTRALTPPPEDYVHDYLSAQSFQDDPCLVDQDVAIYEANTISKSPSYSATRRSMVQPRPIRCASERSDSSSEHSISTAETRSTKEELVDKVKARSDPLYEARPDQNGEYHCPMLKELKCNHAPTRQKCIYNKYVDSHLRPYRCKFADRPECEDARFSSNACLFRHEREAHGLHNHGVNPFLCKFPDCDRARDGNGFPRRWNQRDHMKRVHDYVEQDSPKHRPAPDQPKRRKASGPPTSAPMRRSGSSTVAKEKAMASAAIQAKHYGHQVNQAQYGAPCTYSAPMQDYNALSLSQVQYSPTATISRASRTSPQYSRVYPA